MKNINDLKPIILFGAGRSGTKFLRDVLGASSEIDIVPYDVGYVWRYRNELVEHDEFTVDMLTDEIKLYVRKTLPKLTREVGTKGTMFVEKSVPNTLRPAFTHAIFPEAKFIHLIRDGYAVTESSMRMWQAPPQKGYLLKKVKYFPWENYRYGLWYIYNMIKGKLSSGRAQFTWGPRYKGIDEDAKELPLEVVCARQWKRCVETVKKQLSSFESRNILEVSYENLMKNADTLVEICSFLGLKDTNEVVNHYEKTVVRSNIDKWQSSISHEQFALIESEIGNLVGELCNFSSTL